MTNFERYKQNITAREAANSLVQAKIINNVKDIVYFGPDDVEFDDLNKAVDHIVEWLHQEEFVSHN